VLAKQLGSSSGNTCHSLLDAFCSVQKVFEVMKALAIVLVLGALLPVECKAWQFYSPASMLTVVA